MVRYLFMLAGLLAVTSSWAEFKDFNGKPHQLAEFTGKGKWTIVMFWASDCRVCNAEIGQYLQFHEEHKDKDASIIGISLDGLGGIDAAQNFIKRHAVTFPSLLGDPEAIANLYERLTNNLWVGTPSFLVYDPQGKLQAAQAGAVPPELIEKFIRDNSQTAQNGQ